jgi:hypothetical protein
VVLAVFIFALFGIFIFLSPNSANAHAFGIRQGTLADACWIELLRRVDEDISGLLK